MAVDLGPAVPEAGSIWQANVSKDYELAMMKRLLQTVVVAGGILFLAATIFVGIVFRERRPRIYFAAQAGDTNSLAKYLARGSNVNAAVISDHYGYENAPLLHIAVAGGHPEAVEFLLKQGANPNQFDSHGDSPLCCAIGRGRDDISIQTVRMLIKAGADSNLPFGSKYHHTPLIEAALFAQPEIVEILLREGADVRGTNSIGQTALHFSGQSLLIAGMLVAAGADPNVRDVDGETPAGHALRNGYTNTALLLTNPVLPSR